MVLLLELIKCPRVEIRELRILIESSVIIRIGVGVPLGALEGVLCFRIVVWYRIGPFRLLGKGTEKIRDTID